MTLTYRNLKPFRQMLWQVPALLAMAVLLAIGVNHWRAQAIPLIGDWSEEARFADASGESLIISLDEARAVFGKSGTVFVDARSAAEYERGHIQGALCIPWQAVDSYFMAAVGQLEKAQAIVTYCDGVSCDLSHELTLFLKEMGFENVRVLVNGWSVWRDAGLPTEEGS